jgi:D-alanyl-D-alanine carboxypeptidase
VQKILDRLVADGAAGVLLHYRDEHHEWRGSAGVSDLESRQPVDPDGWFRMGSVTKTYTAAAVLRLVGAGRLGLEDTVERWLPGIVPGGEGIVLRQLLNHTSGLYNYTDDLGGPPEIVRDRYLHWAPTRAIGMAIGHEPLFEPGTDWSYSNTNYVLLGLVLEAASGTEYREVLRTEVLEPLELRQTLVPGDEVKLPEPHAHGYLVVDGSLVDLADLNASQAWAAGELVATAADVNRFFAGLLGGQLLGAAELAAMLTTVDNGGPDRGYGLGLGRRDLGDGTVVWGHNGGIFGYLTSSFHTVDGSRQCTFSRTMADAAAPEADDLVAEVFSSVLD